MGGISVQQIAAKKSIFIPISADKETVPATLIHLPLIARDPKKNTSQENNLLPC